MSYINTKDKCLKTVVSLSTGFYISYWQRPNGTIYTKTEPINTVPGLNIYDWQPNYSGDKRVIATGYYGTPLIYYKNSYYFRRPQPPAPKPIPPLTCRLDVKSIVGNGIIINTSISRSAKVTLTIDGKSIDIDTNIYHPLLEGEHTVILHAYSSWGNDYCSKRANVYTKMVDIQPGDMVVTPIGDYNTTPPIYSLRDFVSSTDNNDLYELRCVSNVS